MCNKRPARWVIVPLLPVFCVALLAVVVVGPGKTAADHPIVKKLESPSDQMELTVNSSRILTLDQKIPRFQVNNPEVLGVTALSPSQIQISAVKPGVTQVNVWGEDGRIFTVDVIVYGDVRELERALKDQFPHSAVRVYRYSNSLVLTGFVERPDHVSRIIRLAEDYAPKVINNISVGGVQQILLHVRVMEISRTKLRAMGFDFGEINGNDFVVSSVSGLLSPGAVASGLATGTGGDTVRFGIVDGNNTFFGFLEALRQYDMMKILAEPKLATVSGRPASFNVGGEFPVLVPQSLGTVSIEYKKFGTQIDFVPLVLGNGNIRLEVRPRVSEIDNTRSVTIDNFTIPGLRVREVDTGVEMKAGQTLAIAGLIQNRQESQNRGIPYLADLPWVGAAFRRVEHIENEIELLILVRPEFVDALDPHECPQGGPGMNTTAPCDRELYWKGHIEVPYLGADGSCVNCPQQHHGEVPIAVEEAKPGTEKLPPVPDDDTHWPEHQSYPPHGIEPLPSDPSPATRRYVPAPVVRPAGLQEEPAAGPAATYRLDRNDSYKSTPTSRTAPPAPPQAGKNPPGLIGPIGYDVLQ